MAILFGMMQYFFVKNKKEDALQMQQQQELMKKIDDVFPALDLLLSSGLEVPTVEVNNESEAAAVTRHQVTEDKVLQSEIGVANGIPLDGGFVS
ncbi:hypothetical protein FACS189452_09290 [Bacteroidia bacterium]|nr:hypothetical protein FACS189452_09290 [Bacteroidia bacterium]